MNVLVWARLCWQVWEERGRTFPWCYVSFDCPEAVAEVGVQGHYYADCTCWLAQDETQT